MYSIGDKNEQHCMGPEISGYSSPSEMKLIGTRYYDLPIHQEFPLLLQ